MIDSLTLFLIGQASVWMGTCYSSSAFHSPLGRLWLNDIINTRQQCSYPIYFDFIFVQWEEVKTGHQFVFTSMMRVEAMRYIGRILDTGNLLFLGKCISEQLPGIGPCLSGCNYICLTRSIAQTKLQPLLLTFMALNGHRSLSGQFHSGDQVCAFWLESRQWVILERRIYIFG